MILSTRSKFTEIENSWQNAQKQMVVLITFGQNVGNDLPTFFILTFF